MEDEEKEDSINMEDEEKEDSTNILMKTLNRITELFAQAGQIAIYILQKIEYRAHKML